MRVERDFLRVFVQNMGLPRQAAPPPLAAMRKHMTEYFMDNPTAPMTAWRPYLKGVKVRVEPVTVNGISGYRAWYTWDRGRSVHYELYKGLDICDLDATSANSTWSTVWPTMNATLHSFRGTQ